MTDIAELKQRARKTWATGDYPYMAEQIFPVGRAVVEAAGISADDDVLDVACGSGNATVPAAEAGANVVGLDLTPELFDAARARAAAAGVEVEWVEGDAEDLPYPEESFDVVLSTFGCMFAPRHEVAAAEIARVLRPGGRMALACWTPEGAIGAFFKTVSALVPPPPGVKPPLLWGTDDHVQVLFRGTGVEVETRREMNTFEYDSLDQGVSNFLEKFGPVIMAKTALEAQGRPDELPQAIRGWLEEKSTSSDGARREMEAEYLLITGRKA